MVSATVHCCALGIETDFGRVLGGFDVIPALVSLSYDGRVSFLPERADRRPKDH